MKTEKEKMLSNELYNHKDAELTKERNHAYELTLRYNQTKDDETELRTSILQQLAGKLGNNVVIKPPFQCDYGYNLILGDNVFMNYGCSILDCNVVEIGNNVLMAPNVQIYAAYHPTDHTLRLKDLEYADRVKIGDNTWIGGGSIILNGVTIGKKIIDDNMVFDIDNLKGFLNDTSSFGFIAKENNKIIGFAYCYTLLRPDGKTMFYLHSIGMLPNYQDKGYGSKLLSFIKEYSKEIGCSEMFLITDKGNPRACHVYEKLGGKNDYKDEIVYVYDYEKGDK